MCELAEESAGGGELDELRERLVAIRLTESPAGHRGGRGGGARARAGDRRAASPRRARVPRPRRRRDAPARRALGPASGLAVRRGDEEAAWPPSRSSPTTSSRTTSSRSTERLGIVGAMEGGFGFPLGGDPEELMKSLQEFAARQAESVAEAQREQFATLTLNTAVELTGAALKRMTSRAAPTSRRSRYATPCASSSPRPSRSSAQPARASCASLA